MKDAGAIFGSGAGVARRLEPRMVDTLGRYVVEILHPVN